ncbi:MAG: 2OG-Fe(II) oxygenase [Acidithiobacillales bacterium SG8_45]|jgi:Rps23 Pro-64 3,4-dihydroxylase Tpa1-like proline 4-hydroxylase|nr:MAG: 2OG-Fe(II) oxygenase [Acidithiobacillales bacterium SG8_45]
MTDSIKTQVAPYAFREVKPLSFIFEVDGALPADVCREMVRRFEANTDQQYQGRVGQQASQDQSIKKTMDLAISAQADWKDVDGILHRSLGIAIREFREKFPFFKGPFKDIGYNMQRYQAGEYYHWHIDGGSHQFADRQLVAIWYLNDVEGPGGETEFLFQDVKITPKEGKLVLFPPFWTHEHRAVTVDKGTKYIATTWVVFA